MRKRMAVCAALSLCILLAGCGAKRQEEVQQHYRAIASAQMQAELVSHLTDEGRAYKAAGRYDREEGFTTTLESPEELAGLSVLAAADGLHLTYDGSVWPAGSDSGLSAANCLPLLLYAAAEGYVTEEGSDRIDGEECIRLTLEATDPAGRSYLCALWVHGTDFSPCYAELSRQGQVAVTARITDFTCQLEQTPEVG